MNRVSTIDRYIGRQIFGLTISVTVVLSFLVLLTQSMRLLDLVLQSGASATNYLTILGLSLPRLVEVVLPPAFFIALLFVYRRMLMDSELVILRSSGMSNLRLMRPILALSAGFMIAVLSLSMWLSPLSIAQLEIAKTDIAGQYAQLLFREGVFNSVNQNLTAYVRTRLPDGRLEGMMVHDTRTTGKEITILAQRGQIVTTPEKQSILVFNGTRQERDTTTGKMGTLTFDRYTIDLPRNDDTKTARWQEPEERSFVQLLQPRDSDTPEQRKELRIELHKRLATPLTVVSYAMLAAFFLLVPQFSRRAGVWPIAVAGIGAITYQTLFFVAHQSLKSAHHLAFIQYFVAILPALLCWYLIHRSDKKG